MKHHADSETGFLQLVGLRLRQRLSARTAERRGITFYRANERRMQDPNASERDEDLSQGSLENSVRWLHAYYWSSGARSLISGRADEVVLKKTTTLSRVQSFSLYLLDDEWAAEIANRTMRGVMHIGWVPDGESGYRGQLAVYVSPNGLLGTGYMAAIRPFRHRIVYPRMLQQIGQAWQTSAT